MPNHETQKLPQNFTDERTGLTYTLVDDWYYLISDKKALPEKERPNLGKFGLLRQSFLKEHRKSVYQELAVSCTLQVHLVDIDQAAHEQCELLIRQMTKHEGVDDALKERDQMSWVAAMNNIRNRAEEVVVHNLIYI